jgi:hypothetical protein
VTEPAYVPWTSLPRGPFRLVITAHANGRLHERKREAWDDQRRTAGGALLGRLIDCGYELWRLNVRGTCRVVLGDLRVVYCVSSRHASVVTVMPVEGRAEPARWPAAGGDERAS